MEILEAKDVTYYYPETDNPAIENINLKINEGEFVLIVGPSGCGKSTLLRLFNRTVPDFYGGKIKGQVFIKNKLIKDMKKEDIVKNIGMVFQHPEKQIVLENVEREIAFGLENLNMDYNSMRRNVAEVMSLLGIENIKERGTSEISGGEKQRVAIASVLAMRPEVIMFDEPISQLDPIGAEDVLNSIKKLNRDFGITVILVEQRLDKCFDMADRIIFMDKGEIVGEGSPHRIPPFIDKNYFLPNISYIFKNAGYKELPVNVKEGRHLIKDRVFNEIESISSPEGEVLIEVKKLSFEYEKGKKVLRDINFNLKKGEVLAVMGENGAGKSTLFKIIAGVIDRYKGNIYINGKDISKLNIEERIKKVGYLSQNPNDYFGRDTVFDEVSYTLKNIGEYDKKRVNDVIKSMNLTEVEDKNPRDLSGGEKQRVAIACTIVSNPEILILDEPTRGMDGAQKENLGSIIEKMKSDGKTIVIITHDADFAGDYSDRTMLLFNGEIIAQGLSSDILFDSTYYSPLISRVFKGKARVIKSKDAALLLKVVK